MSTLTMHANCPFCGSDAILGDCFEGIFVACSNPRCRVNVESNTHNAGADMILGKPEDQEVVFKLLYPGEQFA
jgi:hypothetical protein